MVCLKTRFSTHLTARKKMNKITLEKPAKFFFHLFISISTVFILVGSGGSLLSHNSLFAKEHGENTDLFQSIQHPYSHADIRKQSF